MELVAQLSTAYVRVCYFLNHILPQPSSLSPKNLPVACAENIESSEGEETAGWGCNISHPYSDGKSGSEAEDTTFQDVDRDDGDDDDDDDDDGDDDDLVLDVHKDSSGSEVLMSCLTCVVEIVQVLFAFMRCLRLLFDFCFVRSM